MSRAGRRGETPPRWPSSASRTPALGPLIADIDPGLIPVDLRLLSPSVTLRHKRLRRSSPICRLRSRTWLRTVELGDRGVGKFPQDPPMNAPGRVTLLARRTTVLVEQLVDKGLKCAQLRPARSG